MLYLYRGWNSGTNRAVLDAWRAGGQDLEIVAHDVDAIALSRVSARARALAHALRRGGLRVLLPGSGRFSDAIKRSAWCMERIREAVEKIQESDRFNVSLSVGVASRWSS